MGESMKDKFTVDLDRLAQGMLPKRAYRLADVEHRIERVAYDLVRFRDNEDTDQLWKIQDSPDGPVIVALYGEDGGLKESKGDWETIPDKNAMHIYYKGEPLTSLSSEQLGIPVGEFNIARRWLPRKLASDESLQILLLEQIPRSGRKLIAQRFPELTKVAGPSVVGDDEDWEEDTEEGRPHMGTGPEPTETGEEGWLGKDEEERSLEIDPFRPGPRAEEGFEQRLMPDEPEEKEESYDVEGLISEVLSLFEKGKIEKDKAEKVLLNMIGKAAKLEARKLAKVS
jgi:hypothetical protein